jgi:SAM-dependent methyltransferase
MDGLRAGGASGPKRTLDACVADLQTMARHHSVDLEQWSGLIAARQYVTLVDTLNRYAPKGGSVLDWGSGKGYFAYWLVRNGYLVSATDFHRPDIEDDLRAHAGARFTFAPLSDASHIPFPDDLFDVVASVGVLEHVREGGGDEMSSLREIWRVLRPGGHLICVALPNRRSWVEFLARRAGGAKFSHRYRYLPADVRTMVAGAGLELVALRRYGAFPRNVTNRLPARIRDAPLVANTFDRVDRVAGALLTPFVQNIEFVARKAQTVSIMGM